MGILFFNTQTTQTEELKDIIDTLPKLLQILFGYGTFDKTTLSGSFMNICSYIFLAVFIYLIYISTDITARHDSIPLEDITPVSKFKVIVYKLLAVFFLCFFMIILILGVLTLVLVVKGETNFQYVLAVGITTIPTLFLFIGLGMMIGLLPLSFAASSTLSVLTVIGIFALYLLSNMSDITFLQYFPLAAILNPKTLIGEINELYLTTVFLISCLSYSFIYFIQK